MEFSIPGVCEYKCVWLQSAITLDSPQYAAGGPFTINLWAKTANASEAGPQFLFSHQANIPIGASTTNNPKGPNQAKFLWPCPALPRPAPPRRTTPRHGAACAPIPVSGPWMLARLDPA